MRFGINTIDDFNVQGKTVLCRVDINQPVDKVTGTLKNITRIKACVPTVKELADKGAKVVLLAHQGSDIEYNNFYTTRPHAQVLTELLGREVQFIDDVCGPAARAKIECLAEGEILLLDNVRFLAEEQTLFELKLCLTHEQQSQTLLVQKLAPLADLYVCDAFAAAHRDQPSLCGFEQLLPSAMGRLFEQEYCVISELMESPAHPCIFVLGGAKIADAFLMMETVLKGGVADKVLTGGLVANILLAARGEEIGSGSLDFILKSNYGEYIEKAKALYEEYGQYIMLPRDVAYVQQGKRYEAAMGNIPMDAAITDIGSGTAAEYANTILSAKTVFVNGPMGIFEQEPTELGTKIVWEALGSTQAYTVVGGGDSITATAKFGLSDKMSYICTGGGALIRFLTGEELPVVKALRNGAKKFPAERCL
ncbi:phosphoglycerate kinase [Zhaonella formicivorans]|uniref:phosphoglycerate kinase n=1 Tax=Zhaonella formicivorans TaxID=2528593 RepID=UPI0010E37367|nr:phosphoglycerate kinase [Zhaonella formicivorans]